MYGDRIKILRNKFKDTQQELGEKLGEKWSKIKDIETGRLKLTIEMAKKISILYSVNPWWLLTGDKEPSYSKNNVLEKKKDEYVTIRKYASISASAGNGIENYTGEVENIELSISFLKSFNIIKFKNLEIITAYGSSMEPTIMHKDYLLIDRSHQNIIDGHIYIFRYESEIFVKKLIKLDNGLKAISDNKEYESRTFQNIEILGKVLLSIKELNSTYDI